MPSYLTYCTKINKEGLSRQVRYDYALLVSIGDINEIECYRNTERNTELLSFKFHFSSSGQPKNKLIQWPETIILEYSASTFAAPVIMSGREDFPKDLPHLNPVGTDKPASLCLWRAGTNELYEQAGIRGIIDGLNSWLMDAESGTLQHDGWEPTPRSSNISVIENLSALQEYILLCSQSGEKLVFGYYSGRLIKDDSNKVYAGYINSGRDFRKADNLNTSSLRSTFKKSDTKSTEDWKKIPCYFLIPEEINIVQKHCVADLSSREGIEHYCEQVGIKNEWEKVKQYLDLAVQPGKKLVSLIYLPCFRPFKLIAEIPNISKENAGKIEIIPVLVYYDNDFNYHVCSISYKPSKDLLSDITNSNFDSSISIIGCGALGSVIADNIARSGGKHINLVDGDIFKAHNISRHILQEWQNGFPKSFLLEVTLEKITGDNDYKSFPYKLEDCKNEIQDEILQAGMLIDCTANNTCDAIFNEKLNSDKAYRCYIGASGMLGFIFSANNNTSIMDFFDLELVALYKNLDKEYIEAWLSNSNTNEVMIGQSCSSMTMKMPLSVIQQHASAFLAFMQENIHKRENTIGINVLDTSFLPNGFERVLVGSMERYTLSDQNEDWVISIHNDVQQKIIGSRKNLEVECGGYLLGDYDYSLKRVSIVGATFIKGAVASKISLELPPAINDEELMAFLDKSKNRLKCLGTWHSHPGSSDASPTDFNTLKNVRKLGNDFPMPFVMYIQGAKDEDSSQYLALPEIWEKSQEGE